MELWVLITLVAATAQASRFVLQKHLKDTRLSTAGATYARFAYSAPLVAVIAAIYAMMVGTSWPALPWAFAGFGAMGALSQIFGTMCVVSLFAHRNFAVGMAFKKTEVILSFLVGLILLGDQISVLALLAIVIGLPGVLLLSDPPSGGGPLRARIFNKAAGLGLLSGLFFAMSGVGYRGASLSLGMDDSFFSAIVTLTFVTAFQAVIMTLWLLAREPGEIGRVAASWRVSGLVGVTSMIGSACWFWAFTLQAVALVNAVGQVEMILSLMATTLIFKERITAREWQGMALLMASILLLVLVA